MSRCDWSLSRPGRHVTTLLPALFFFTFLQGFNPALADWSSSNPSSSSVSTPELDAELIRDGPLYPPLRNTHDDNTTLDNIASNNDLVLETSIEQTRVLDMQGIDETEHVTKVQRNNNVDREKRSSERTWEDAPKSKTSSGRVKTGDTILNIRGAVRDAIGDAGAAPGPRASSRIDTFVIRPSQQHRPAVSDQPRAQPSTAQIVKNERELIVEAHSRAVVACDLVNVTILKWYKDKEVINLPTSAAAGGSDGVWRSKDTVVIGRAGRGDAGTWRCAGVDRAGNTVYGKPTPLLIYEPVRSVYLAVDGRRLDAGNTWVPVRDKTELEVHCVAEGGTPSPELTWRLVAQEPTLDHRPYLRIHNTNYSIEGVSSSHAVVTAARELHNAALHCEARQRKPHDSLSIQHNVSPQDVLVAKLEIHVTYPPSFVISRWPGFGVSLSAGAAAALRCDVDANPSARAWWQRDDADPTSSPPPLEAGDETTRDSATLRWDVLRGSHAGWYRCRATWLSTEYSSIGYYLNIIEQEENVETITEPEVDEEEPDHHKVEVPIGGNVQLHCPKGSVGCWWRRIVGNTSDNWAPAGSHHAHGVLGIRDALYQEDGEYRCVGARGPDLTRLRELKRVTLKVTGGATATALSAEPAAGGWRLECGACGRGVKVVWIRRDGVITPASLAPDLAQHCWRAVLHVSEPDEVWCVAASGAGGGVAVFPPRLRASPPPRTPATPAHSPSRHTVRALQNSAAALLPSIYLLVALAST